MLFKKSKLLLKLKDAASTFSKHFGSITNSLNLFSWPKDTLMSAGNEQSKFHYQKISFSPK